MEDVRDYSYELNPSTVERAGLRPALDRLLTRMRERFTGSLRLNVDPFLKLDPNVAPALYQIAQEAVENAVTHSGCSSIEIAVKSTRSGPALEVRDNGHGFDPGEIASGTAGAGAVEHGTLCRAGRLESLDRERPRYRNHRARLVDGKRVEVRL